MRYKIMEACVPKQKSTKGKVDFKFRISSLLVWLCTYDMWSSNVFGALPTLQGFFLSFFVSLFMNITLLNSFHGTKCQACIILCLIPRCMGKHLKCVV